MQLSRKSKTNIEIQTDNTMQCVVKSLKLGLNTRHREFHSLFADAATATDAEENSENQQNDEDYHDD